MNLERVTLQPQIDARAGAHSRGTWQLMGEVSHTVTQAVGGAEWLPGSFVLPRTQNPSNPTYCWRCAS